MKKIISREEAKALGLTRYFTGKACRRNHICERWVSGKTCVECRKLNEKSKSRQEYLSAYAKNRWAKNSDKQRKHHADWRLKNPDYYPKYRKDYYDAHPGLRAHELYLRRASKYQRTPPWANLEAIKKIYLECARLSKETGIKYHVDHIIPLRGKLVSGLHVETNLQIITAKENNSKSNKFKVE